MNKRRFTFLAVGVINTVIDMGLYTLLMLVGWFPFYIANFISASTGIGCSYILNSKYTFNRTTRTGRSAVAFFLVTAFGLWILQPIIIWFIQKDNLIEMYIPNQAMAILIPKAIATCVTLVWNYTLYSRWVFADRQK